MCDYDHVINFCIIIIIILGLCIYRVVQKIPAYFEAL